MKQGYISLIILTNNGLPFMVDLFEGIWKQTIRPEIIVLDSESTDGTQDFLQRNNIEFHTVPKKDFNHGRVRNFGMSLAHHEIVVFLTQDAALDNACALEQLIAPLTTDDQVAMSYGRQLPRHDATLFSEFARLNNYPEKEEIKSQLDADRLGIKTFFISNSFAAYKKSILNSLGNFPLHAIMCEDVYAGGKAILAGYRIAYVPKATAVHSHNYSIIQELKRYFDIGYFYHTEGWIGKSFRKAESEGLAYIRNEFNFILKRKKWILFPEMIIRTFMKYAGYKLGSLHFILPVGLKQKLSMHSYYWNRELLGRADALN